MPPEEVAPKLLSWASELDEQTLAQARRTARLPIIAGHVALMPDAHLGIGSTVGSVIPTSGAIIPAAIGVDIGCGMIAARTDLRATDLPDGLEPFVDAMQTVVPAGLGKWHAEPKPEAYPWWEQHRGSVRTRLTDRQVKTLLIQLGT